MTRRGAGTGWAVVPGASRAGPVRQAGLVGTAILLGLAACGDDAQDLEDIRRADAAAATTAPTGPQFEGTLQVMAATPLSDAFAEIDATFEERHPGLTVEIDYGGSSLRDLVLAGVPADVFATGDPADMDALAEGEALAGTPVTFATDGSQTAYTIATLSGSANAAAADGFVAFVLSRRTDGILSDHGFTPP